MRHRSWIAAVAVIAVLLFIPTTRTATAETTIEQYRGFAVAMGSVAPGKNAGINIGIFRYSTEEERQNFLKILKEQGSAALHDAMFNSPQVAFLKVDGSMGYKLRFAREVKDAAGKRHLIFAADRPVSFSTTRRTSDYDFTFIELILDENGKGEGSLALGVAVGWDKEKDVPALETYSSEPMRVMNVTRIK